MRFSDKICVVTGAGSGIGKAIAKQFAREGAKVAVLDLSEPNGSQTAREISTDHGQSIFLRCNVGDSGEIQAAIGAVLEKWGRIDILVNDAAMMTFKPIVELP